jgi:Holliday junction resolvasome RuvABC DNA-binding subunit
VPRRRPAGQRRAARGAARGRRPDQAVSALVNLGYKRPEAERAVQRVARPAVPLEDVIRAALQGLAG